MNKRKDEVICVVKLRDGRDLELVRPTMGDFFRVMNESSMFLEQVILMATRLPKDEIDKIDYADGVRIMVVLQPYMEEINQYQVASSQHKKNTIN